MKKKLSLLVFFLMLGFYSPAILGDDGITSDVHAGPERSFQKISDASVIVTTQFGYGTGTVVKYKKNVFVITAKHVVSSRFGEEVSIKIAKGQREVGAKVVYKDLLKDLVVLSIDDEIVEKPVHLDLRRSKLKIGSLVGYCGYPNRRDLSCFSGMVSGFPGEYINMHSYAFSGASGSLVFDRRGDVVGVLSAIEVGEFFGLPTPLESVVWVVPIDESLFSWL